MFYLDLNKNNIVDAVSSHWKYYQCRIKKKLGANNCSPSCKVCKSTKIKRNRSAPFNIIRDYLNDGDNLKDIILGLPQNLTDYNSNFFSHIIPGRSNDLNLYFAASKEDKPILYPDIHNIIRHIKDIFDYDELSGAEANALYSAYDLAENLDRRSCTYCNRTYTNTLRTHDKKKVMRPQFDHWYPKSKYPLLAISFYNLIPSCYTCNSSIKKDLVFNTIDNIHPYIDKDQITEFKFNYFYSAKLDKYRIYITPTDSEQRRAFTTLKALKIDEMYNSHYEELKDLIMIKQAYSDNYIKKMQDLFPKSNLTKTEIYRLLFGAELESENIHKRPLSKFKNDILRQLGILIDD